MCDGRSNSHLGSVRQVMNTTCQAFAPGLPSQAVSASRAASASLIPVETNVEHTPGLEVESSSLSGDQNQLPAPTRVAQVDSANDYKPASLQHQRSSNEQIPERFNLEGPNNASGEVMNQCNRDEPDSVQVPIISEKPTTPASAAVQPAAVSQDPNPAPKWIRVGERVCFSTVVSAVLIPSAEDISATSKRELWWQPEDFFEFRMNHARRQASGKSATDDDDEEDNSMQTPVVTPTASVATTPSRPEEGSIAVRTGTTDGRSSFDTTATVEGVLIVAATPACGPTVVASRSPSSARRVDANGRKDGDNSRTVEDIKGGVRPPYLVAQQPDSKWAPRGEKDARADYQRTPRRFTDNRGRGTSAGANHGGQKRYGRGNRAPPTWNSAGGHGRRATGHHQFPSYRNHVAQRSFEPSQLYGVRYGSVAISGVYAPAPNHGRGPLYNTGAHVAMPEPFLMSQYSRQQHAGMHEAMGGMPPAHRVHPEIMMVRAHDAKPQFSMWRSPVFAPIMMQCPGENVVR